MKYLLFIFLFFSTYLKAQTKFDQSIFYDSLLYTTTEGTLKFDQWIDRCENKWVAFQKNKDNKFTYGYIYMDFVTGLSLKVEGTYIVNQESTFHPDKIQEDLRIALPTYRTIVAIIPKTKFKELQIQETPEWLKDNKSNATTIEELYKWGYLYNSWSISDSALKYFEKAQKINPKYKGLEYEIAKALGGKYDKVIEILRGAIESNPGDCFLYQELYVAELEWGEVDSAEKTVEKAINICLDREVKGKIVYDLIRYFSQFKNKDKFTYWVKKYNECCHTSQDEYWRRILSKEQQFDD